MQGGSRMFLPSPHIGPAVICRELDAAFNLVQELFVPREDVVDHRLETLADVHVVAVSGGILSRECAQINTRRFGHVSLAFILFALRDLQNDREFVHTHTRTAGPPLLLCDPGWWVV